jgi:hypothetical protein
MREDDGEPIVAQPQVAVLLRADYVLR